MNSAGDKKSQINIRTIFIADDDSDDVQFISEAIKQISPVLCIENLKNGSMLIDPFSHYLPGILFLDLDMPVKNGLQCPGEIWNVAKSANLPIVVYTGTNKPSNIETDYEVGEDLVFIKPNNFSQLIYSVSKIIGLDWSNPKKIREKYCFNGQLLAIT